jgi:hypothetical protein
MDIAGRIWRLIEKKYQGQLGWGFEIFKIVSNMVFGGVLMFKPVTYSREFFCGEVSRPLSRKVRPATVGIYNEWGRNVFEVRLRGVRNQGSLCFFGKVFAV